MAAKRWPGEFCYWHPSGMPAIAGVRWGALGFSVQVILEDGVSTRWIEGCPVEPPARLVKLLRDST